MQSFLGSEEQKSQDIARSGPHAFWPVDLKITHLDWNPEANLIHFQGQYLTICELDYIIIQGEIQNAPKTRAAVDIGEFCLVEDVTSARWYRGRVQNRKKDLFDVFLIDHGNVLTVDEAHISSCCNDFFILPPKIVCGFLSSVLLLSGCCHSDVEKYFLNLIGQNVTGCIQALLPHKVLLLEAPDINSDLVRHGFGRHIDTDTFLLLFGMLIEAPLKQNIEPAPDLLVEKQRGQEFFKPTSLQGYKEIFSFCRTRLRCGTRATVRVTAAVSPELFYCQMANNEADLKELSSKLATVWEFKSKVSQQETPDNHSQLCSVKGKDEKWYRGFIQQIPVSSEVRVLFIDYGYVESVKIENVHRLPSDFYSYPIMALPCALSCVNNDDQSTKPQQLSFLKAGLLGKVLEVEITKFKEEQHLYYMTILDTKDVVTPTLDEDNTKAKVGISDSKAEQIFHQGGPLFYETIIRKELDKTLEDEEVHVGSVFVGYVEYAENPNHFWIRTKKRDDEFESMMNELSKHFSNIKLDTDVLENPEPGKLCCALYEKDMHYYRGVVVNTLEHGAEVLFIDFGNIEKVPHMLIKKIPETFAKKSAFAFCCSLVNVIPMDAFWTNSTSEFFRRCVLNKAMQVRVVQMQKNKFVVALHELGDDSEQCISEFLILSNKAMYGKNISEESVGQKEKCMPQRNKNQSPSTNSKQKVCNKEKKSSVDKAEAHKASLSFKPINIKPGIEFAVYCSCIHSPYNFWCQRLDQAANIEAHMTKLQVYYSTNTVPLEPETSCCVAKLPHDGKWYRAFITERQNSQAKVMLVDFGFTIQVNENNLQALLPEFFDLEGQAFRCSLYSLIEPTTMTWNSDAMEFLRRFICDSGSDLRCIVVSQLNVENRGLFNVVELFNTESKQSLSNLLLEQGLAQKVLTNLSPAVCPESFVYSSYDLNVGSEEQVFVTYVSSHFEVLCQLDKNTDIFEKIEVKISEEVEKIRQASTGTVGKILCLAKYLDGMWYRGIAHATLSPSHLSVYFVDYGNKMIAETSHVIFIPRDSADLLYTPMQAVKFSLASVPQDQVSADVKDWLERTVLNKQTRAVVVGKCDDGSFKVKLFDGDVSINDKLNELIHSLTPKPKIAVTFKKNSKTTKQPVKGKGKTFPMCNAYRRMDFSNKQKVNTKTGPVKSQERKVKPNKNTNMEEKNKPTSPLKSPQVPQPRPVSPQVQDKKGTTDKTAKAEQTNIPEISCLPVKKLTEGLKTTCFATHIESRSSFFLQLSDDEPDILKLVDTLNSSISRDTLTKSAGLMLKINNLVLAEYEEDGALYRAVVKEYVGSSSFKVEFVDYGNSAVMGKEKLYLIPNDYICQPRYSIPCSLLDSKAYESDVAFTDAVTDKPLMVEFVCHNGFHWKVKVENLDLTPSVPLQAAVQTETVTPTEVKCPTMKAKRKCKKYYRRYPMKMTPKKDVVDVFMPHKIKSKAVETGLVLSVQSNGDFYVRLSKTSDKLASLDALIFANMHRCEPVPLNDVKEGLKCLVQGQHDSQWHRAVVKKVTQDTCLVLLLDYGKMEKVAKGSLRQMMSTLTMIPPFAVRCKLNFLDFSDKRNQKVCHKSVELIEGKDVKLMFVTFSEKQQLWLVDVIINRLFLTDPISTPEKQNEKPVIDTQALCDPTPDTSLPQKLAFAPIELNKEYSGFAAAVTTPFDFWIVLEDLYLMSQVIPMFDDLPNELLPLPQAHLVPGTGCLVNLDSKWCRAEIECADCTPLLNLVDYGHKCLLYKDHSELKKIPENIIKLPKVTYPCLLKGVKPIGPDDQWPDEAIVFFQQCLDQSNLQIFFRESMSDCNWKVDILANGVHVAKQLVDLGHASYIDVILGLRYQEQSPAHCLWDEDTDEGSEGNSSKTMEDAE